MEFKKWLAEGYRTGAKLGLYPPIEDALGQYPFLYGTARSADLITYIDIMYGKKGIDSKNGLVYYHEKDPRVRNTK